MVDQTPHIVQNPNSLYVTIRTPDRILYQGQAVSITSSNENGTFDVLGLHANFISVINRTIVVHLADKTQKEFPVENGVMRVVSNTVTVLLGIKTLTQEK